MQNRTFLAHAPQVVGMVGAFLLAAFITQGAVDYWQVSGKYQQHHAIACTVAPIALYLAPLAFVRPPVLVRAVKLISLGSACTAAAMGLDNHTYAPARDGFYVLAVAVSLLPLLAVYLLSEFFTSQPQGGKS